MKEVALEEQVALLRHERFPRSSAYDPAWLIEHQMGPNVLWLTEALCEVMELQRGMRVLDLGCGKALSSIFLAREFEVQVWATDLWIPASENSQRISAAGLNDNVFPIHADARALPFADAFFDAIICVDALEYFGTDDLYLPSLVRLLKPGCLIGAVNAGVRQELDVLPPEFPMEFAAFHSPEWWRRHWSLTRCVEVLVADELADGRELWMRWDRAIGWSDNGYLTCPAGESLGFNRIVARRASV